jgi:hypothetical protein
MLKPEELRMAKHFQNKKTVLYFSVLVLVLGSWFSESRYKLTINKQEKAKIDNNIVNAILEKHDQKTLGSNTLTRSSSCNIESLNGMSFKEVTLDTPAAAALELAGWAFDKRMPPSQQKLLIRFQSKADVISVFSAPITVERRDVAASLNLGANHRNLGFHVRINRADLAAGEYRLALIMVGNDESFFCDQGRSLIVR